MTAASTEIAETVTVVSSRALPNGDTIEVRKTQRARGIKAVFQAVCAAQGGTMVSLTPPMATHIAASLRDAFVDALRVEGFPLERQPLEYLSTAYERTFDSAGPTDAAVAAMLRESPGRVTAYVPTPLVTADALDHPHVRLLMPSERMRYLKFIPTTPEPPRLTRDELRAQLDATPHARLVDLVLDLTDADHELLLRVRRIVLAQTDAVAAVTLLRAEIDRTLRVHCVEWDEVSAFVNELEAVQGEIHALGRTDAKAALDVAFYFLETLPRVFDAVRGECELQMFSEDFVRTTILPLVAQTATPFEMAAERLLRSVAADGYGHFNDIADVVRGACTTPAMDRALLRVAEEMARLPDGGGMWVVENLVDALRMNG